MRQTLVVFLITLSALVMQGCTTASMDTHALQQYQPERIGVVIGHAYRVETGRAGGRLAPASVFYRRLDPRVEHELNQLVFRKIDTQLTAKGYAARLVKAAPMEWDLYENITDTPRALPRLMGKHQPLGIDELDTILFLECLIEPKLYMETQIISDPSGLSRLELSYAKAKIWLFEPGSGRRLYFSLRQKGYERVLSHVGPGEAIAEILDLSGLPAREGAAGR